MPVSSKENHTLVLIPERMHYMYNKFLEQTSLVGTLQLSLLLFDATATIYLMCTQLA